MDGRSAFFLPGWGAPAALYEPGLPDGWTALEPPSFSSGAGVAARADWLERELARAGGPVVLGGHSTGAALAILAAAARPERVARLVLVSPAGLPLAKPLVQSARSFVAQLLSGLYPRHAVAAGVAALARAPRSALRLAREVRALDLSAEMARVQAAGVPAVVVGCTTDTLVLPALSERVAALLGAEYREFALAGGHMWMLGDWSRLAAELAQ